MPLDYGLPAGELALREALATYLGRARGVLCTAEDIVITGGTMRSLDLIVSI